MATRELCEICNRRAPLHTIGHVESTVTVSYCDKCAELAALVLTMRLRARMVRLADAWIDTEGPAFLAYYHEQCLPEEPAP